MFCSVASSPTQTHQFHCHIYRGSISLVSSLHYLSLRQLNQEMDQSIAPLARRCQGLFEECSRTAKLRGSEWFENRQADFNLWAATTKSTSEGKTSLAHRLRNRPDVCKAITSFLSALSECLDECSKTGQFPRDPPPNLWINEARCFFLKHQMDLPHQVRSRLHRG